MSYGEPPQGGPPPGGPPPGGPPPGGPPPGDNPYQTPYQAGGPPPPMAEVPGGIETNPDARMWGMFCHLSAILLGVFGPLICWLVKKDQYPFVDRHGKESLNFQLTILIVVMGSIPLVFLFCIGFVVMMAASIYALVMCILAGLKANNGEEYVYPLTIRMIK